MNTNVGIVVSIVVGILIALFIAWSMVQVIG